MVKNREEENVGVIARGTGFIGDAWAELKKVHTPTRQETITASIGVFGMVVFFSLSLGLIDWAIGWIVRSFLYV